MSVVYVYSQALYLCYYLVLVTLVSWTFHFQLHIQAILLTRYVYNIVIFKSVIEVAYIHARLDYVQQVQLHPARLPSLCSVTLVSYCPLHVTLTAPILFVWDIAQLTPCMDSVLANFHDTHCTKQRTQKTKVGMFSYSSSQPRNNDNVRDSNQR